MCIMHQPRKPSQTADHENRTTRPERNFALVSDPEKSKDARKESKGSGMRATFSNEHGVPVIDF